MINRKEGTGAKEAHSHLCIRCWSYLICNNKKCIKSERQSTIKNQFVKSPCKYCYLFTDEQAAKNKREDRIQVQSMEMAGKK